MSDESIENKVMVSAQELNQEIIDDLFAILGDGYAEIVDDQVEQGTEYLAALGVALAENAPEKVSKGAHLLKSSAGQIGLQGIHELARDLEKSAIASTQAGTGCSAEQKELYAALQNNFEAAVQVLRDYLKNSATI